MAPRLWRFIGIATGAAACSIVAIYGFADTKAAAAQTELQTRVEEGDRVRELAESQARELAAAEAKHDAVGIRLSDTNRFPETRRDEVRRVIDALTKEGMNPGKYLAYVSERAGELSFYLRHEKHPTNFEERGDICGKCLNVIFSADLRSLKIYGIK